MIRFLKQNKTFSFLLLITIITFISSIFLTIIIDSSIKNDIHQNVVSILKNRSIQKDIFLNSSFFHYFYQNASFVLLFWFLGISIIGIPIILFFYLLKILLFSWNCFFLISHFSISHLLFIILYLCSSFIVLLILFFIAYYAISYSNILFHLLFLKRNVPIYDITKNYLKILFFSLFCSMIFSLIEYFLFPKIIDFF